MCMYFNCGSNYDLRVHFANGVPAIKEIGFFKFIFGTEWRPTQGIFGIGPMIIGSIYVTAGAMVVGVPIGLLTAVF